jgi:NADH:ubiquinone oxidoreductase subunit E
MESGEQLERCLERYPQYREHLLPLLEVAQTLLGHQPEAQPSPAFIVDLKERLTRTQG